MKKLLLTIITLLITVGCATTNGDYKLKNSEAARVFDKIITVDDFEAELEVFSKRHIPEGYQLTDKELLDFKTQVLNSIIQRHMFEIKMDHLGIKADIATADKNIDDLIKSYGTKDELLIQLETKGYTFDSLYSEILFETRLYNLRMWIAEQDINIPEEDIVKYYNDKLESEFSKPSYVSARHIIVLTENRSEAEALEKIESVRNEIVNGLDFSEAAIKYSEGPSSSEGGLLRPFTKGEMVDEFEDVCFSLPENTLSEPVLTQYGYHLIMVESREDSIVTPIEDAKEYIKDAIINNNFFTDLKSEANIIKIDFFNETN